jgi:hypothetical protein
MEGERSVWRWWQRLLVMGAKQKPASSQAEGDAQLCCAGRVHIAYRGLADDRLYIAYAREWADARYFKRNGLRVFCADCRHRLL